MATGAVKTRRFVSFDEARTTILARAAAAVMPRETVPLDDALGRTLRTDVVAHEPFPRFDNSAMDGYAVRAADVARASASSPVTLPVIETLAAGRAASLAITRGEAIRIMTGAPLPAGADAVVPIEQTEVAERVEGDGTIVSVRVSAPVVPGEHVRPTGEDFRAGEVLVRAGAVVDPGVIAVLAALGHAEVEVALPPRVAILSTGDELVMPGQPVGPGQIRDSNTHMMRALVRAAGCETGPCWHLADDPAAVTSAVARVVDHCDAILSLGGVSAGAFDPVREALPALGEVELWRVGMRPGQPQAFGLAHGKLFFGLPGNPVSSAVVFEMLVRPALWTMLGRTVLDRPTVRAVLAEPVESKAGRRDFLRVTLEELDAAEAARVGAPYQAHLTGTQSSGAVSSILRAEGLAVIEGPAEQLPQGTLVSTVLLEGAGHR